MGIWLDISVISPTRGYFDAIFENVTARKRDEQERETTIEFLRLVNSSKNVDELIESAATFFQRQSGCEAVGIRLKEGFDYPYYEARGFPQGFVLLETRLCSYDEQGKVCRDRSGYPILECMGAGNVICGRFDPTKDFFTANGSFWTDNTTRLLATSTEEDRQARTRNRCNGEGYGLVALIPLYLGKERLGLVQMNDRRIGIYSQLIAQWERLAGYLSVALSNSSQMKHSEELRNATQPL